jgi:PleD family two-component response regulator
MYSGVRYDKVVNGNKDEHTPNNSISSHENTTNLNTLEEKRVSKVVLIVDDDPDMTSIFSLGLQDEGFEVYTFNDSLEVLSHFRPNFYDLMLLISICQK